MVKKTYFFLFFLFSAFPSLADQLEVTSWTLFKQIVVTGKNLPLQYVNNQNQYDIYGPDANSILWHVSIPITNPESSDQTDFETNYEPYINKTVSVNTISTLQSGTGTISGLSQVVVASPTACGSIVFSLMGTWSGTINFEASVDGVNYIPINGIAPNYGTVNDYLTFNTPIVFSCGGYAYIEAIATAWSSGVSTVSWSATSGNNFVNQGVAAGSANSWPVYIGESSSNNIGTVSGSTVQVQNVAGSTMSVLAYQNGSYSVTPGTGSWNGSVSETGVFVVTPGTGTFSVSSASSSVGGIGSFTVTPGTGTWNVFGSTVLVENVAGSSIAVVSGSTSTYVVSLGNETGKTMELINGSTTTSAAGKFGITTPFSLSSSSPVDFYLQSFDIEVSSGGAVAASARLGSVYIANNNVIIASTTLSMPSVGGTVIWTRDFAEPLFFTSGVITSSVTTVSSSQLIWTANIYGYEK